MMALACVFFGTALQPAAADKVIGNIVVIQADATVLQPGELFDLDGKTLTFMPRTDNGYAVNVGNLAFDSSLGNALNLGDDDSVLQSLGFTFRFYGVNRTSVFINSNGNLTFDTASTLNHFNSGGSGASLGTDLQTVVDRIGASPRIAPLWQDWNPAAGGGVFSKLLADRLVITWDAVGLNGVAASATFQVVLFSSGVIQISYQSVALTPPGGYLVGISAGASNRNLVNTVDFSRGPAGTVSSFPRFEPLVQVFGNDPAPRVSFFAVARKLYALQGDYFDTIATFTAFSQPSSLSGFGFHNGTQNATGGIGRATFNNSSFAGSKGRLQGILNMNRINLPIFSPPTNVNASRFLAHETGHTWLANVKYDDGGICSDLLLDDNNQHWSFYNHTGGSVMFGNTWQDNGNGTFTSTEISQRYGPLDQYLMGLRAAAEISPSLLIRDGSTPVPCTLNGLNGSSPRSCQPALGVTVSGTRQDVSISQVVTCNGARSPASGFSGVNPTNVWTEAFVLVIPAGTSASPADLAKLETLRTAFGTYYHDVATQGRGSVVTTLPTSISLNCPTDSLQAAVDAVMPGITINVSGVCTENVLVRNEKQRITLDGGGTGTIDGPSVASPTVNVRGKGILIQGFTITGGSDGVYANRGSNAVISNNFIQSSNGNGVVVDELAFAVLTNNTIQNNPGAGVVVSEASTARIGFNADSETVASANTIQNNGLGIVVMNGASARIVGNNIINNTADGVQVLRDSHADIASNTISSNGGDGIEVGENSTIQLGEDSGTSIFETPNTTASANTGFGVKCSKGGIADGRTSTLSGSAGAKSFVDSGCIDNLIP